MIPLCAWDPLEPPQGPLGVSASYFDDHCYSVMSEAALPPACPMPQTQAEPWSFLRAGGSNSRPPPPAWKILFCFVFLIV